MLVLSGCCKLLRSHLVLVYVDGGLNHSRVSRLVDLLVARVVRAEAGGHVLFCNHFCLIFDKKDFVVGWGPSRRGVLKDRSAYHGFLVLAQAGFDVL